MNKPSRVQARRNSAFTLLELIVTIVVLAVLAAIAVPTFQKVLDRSTDEAKAASLAAIGREASALAALDQSATVTPEHYAQATADLEAAGYELGVTAAGGRKWKTTTMLVEEGTFTEAPTYSTDPYTVSVAEPAAEGEPTTAAVQSETGNCIFSTVTEPGDTPETWIVDRGLGTNCGTGGATTWTGPEDTASIPVGETVPTFGASSGAVENLKVVALGAGAEITFDVPNYRGTTPITGYEVVATDGTTTQRQTVAGLNAIFSNLPVAGAPYTFTVMAINDAGPGEERDASAAAPTATGTIGSRDVQTGTDYSCPNGGSVAGSNCSVPAYAYAAAASTAFSHYSCPSGGNLSGTTCYVSTTQTYAATATAGAYYGGPWGAQSGGCTWDSVNKSCSGSSTTQSSYSVYSNSVNGVYRKWAYAGEFKGYSSTGSAVYAVYYRWRDVLQYPTTYSCPSGGSLSGTTCYVSSTSTYGASSEYKTTYSCPDGGSLSSTTCNVPESSYQATATAVMEKHYDATLTSYTGAQKALVNGTPYTGSSLDLGPCPGRIVAQVIGIGGTTEIDLGSRC